MKNSTKFKIINWIERMLKYQQPVQIPLREEKRQIQEVRWSALFRRDEMVRMKPQDINSMISFGITQELNRLDVIQVNEEKTEHGITVSARAFFIEPPERWQNER